MSKLLSELLQAREPLFSIALDDLERASGRLGVDVQLTADVASVARRKIKELGLDPADTTGRELYHALLDITAKHDNFLVKHLGAEDPSDVADLLPRIIAAVEHLRTPKTTWAIKGSVAKRMLKKMPPKHVMVQLGYRSVDSMLKRENVCELYGALRFAESAEWMATFIKQYEYLQPADFETRRIDIIQLDAQKWGTLADNFIRQNRHNVTHLKEMGIIVVLPLPVKNLPGLTITLVPLLQHYINEIRVYSAYFRLQQVTPDFGAKVADVLATDPSHHANMAGQRVHWRIIHHYYSRQAAADHPEIFEPHVQPEDLFIQKAEELLYRLEPALHFWHGMDFVGINLGGDILSYNLMDMAVSYMNNLPYAQRATQHFQNSLWNEIYIRYMGQKTLEHQVLRQLDRETLNPDLIGLEVGDIR